MGVGSSVEGATAFSTGKKQPPTTVPSVVLLGLAQDGGVPQAGCSCQRCMAVHEGRMPELYPVALGITDADGGFHLVEASRTLSKQLWVWAKAVSNTNATQVVSPVRSVILTHMHLGHVDGLGQFGKEVMDRHGVRLITSAAVLEELERRGTSRLEPFAPHPLANEDNDDLVKTLELGRDVSVELHRVPHRDFEGIGDMHAIVIRGIRKSLLFLPDHDSWDKTLGLHKAGTIRDWLTNLKVDVALLDGTFWSLDEIHGGHKRDYGSIPHPPISQTIQMLGPKRSSSDPDIFFIHLNHTNPVIDSSQIRTQVEDLGWHIGTQGQTWQIG